MEGTHTSGYTSAKRKDKGLASACKELIFLFFSLIPDLGIVKLDIVTEFSKRDFRIGGEHFLILFVLKVMDVLICEAGNSRWDP